MDNEKGYIISTNELIELLHRNSIVIYGAGYVAERFCNALKSLGLYNQIKYFITTNTEKSFFCEKRVVNIHDIRGEENCVYCIAVHESIRDEIIEKLKQKEIERYVWVYPNLYEMILGEPIHKNVTVLLKDIWMANRDNYSMAVRYLVIDNYYGKNDYGYEIYKKAMELYCSAVTAQKRLDRFICLIESWELNGFDKKQPVLLFDNLKFFDGAHRISLASYFREKDIAANIYLSQGSSVVIHNKEAFLSANIIMKSGLECSLIGLFEEVNKYIDEQFGLM